jgi:hypothetical protein
MDWFRLYSEARTDRKLGTLTLAERGVWINLLCYANEREARGSFSMEDVDLLALECAEGDVAVLTATLEKLLRVKHLVRLDGNTLAFRTFETRQYTKPSSAPERVNERVRAYRERQRNARVTPCNAPVTRSNTLYSDTDTDTERDNGEGERAPVQLNGNGHHPALTAAVAATLAPDLLKLTAQVTKASRLNGHDPDALSNTLAQYHTRDPSELVAEAAKAAEWVRDGKGRTMNVRFLDRWFKRAFREEAMNNGAIQRPDTANGRGTRSHPSADAIEQPDHTRNGVYEKFIQR